MKKSCLSKAAMHNKMMLSSKNAFTSETEWSNMYESYQKKNDYYLPDVMFSSISRFFRENQDHLYKVEAIENNEGLKEIRLTDQYFS